MQTVFVLHVKADKYLLLLSCWAVEQVSHSFSHNTQTVGWSRMVDCETDGEAVYMNGARVKIVSTCCLSNDKKVFVHVDILFFFWFCFHFLLSLLCFWLVHFLHHFHFVFVHIYGFHFSACSISRLSSTILAHYFVCVRVLLQSYQQCHSLLVVSFSLFHLQNNKTIFNLFIPL